MVEQNGLLLCFDGTKDILLEGFIKNSSCSIYVYWRRRDVLRRREDKPFKGLDKMICFGGPLLERPAIIIDEIFCTSVMEYLTEVCLIALFFNSGLAEARQGSFRYCRQCLKQAD